MKVLVSACLLGKNCKYNGGNNYSPEVINFLKNKEFIEICPEILAGMSAPRPPVEIVNGKVMDNSGRDLDKQYRLGVSKAMEMVKDQNISVAILQSRSPTCGVNQIYDGTFSRKLVSGQGILAKALKDAGYEVIDVEDLKDYQETH